MKAFAAGVAVAVVLAVASGIAYSYFEITGPGVFLDRGRAPLIGTSPGLTPAISVDLPRKAPHEFRDRLRGSIRPRTARGPGSC